MNAPPALTREQSRAIDQIAINQYGIPGMVLMENAGRGVVDVLLKLDPSVIQNPDHGNIAILCGKGNNAGDGFVIARHLALRGARPKVFLFAPPSDLQGDALQNYQILTHCDVPIVDLSKETALETALNNEAASATWLIDALLGTGAHGEPRDPLPAVIHWANTHFAKRLAIDLPSGLDCDTGQPTAHCIQADHTCTFVTPKIGFAIPAAQQHLGQLHVVSIGVPAEIIAKVESDEKLH